MSEGHLYCVHTIRFSELTKNLQFGTKTITGYQANSSAPFIFQEECQIKIEHVLFPSAFYKITDLCVGRSFSMWSHDPMFETNKNWILKNGSCEQALMPAVELDCSSCNDGRNKTNDLILNLTPENVTQHSRIVTTTRKGSSTPTKMSKIIGRQIH